MTVDGERRCWVLWFESVVWFC